MEESRQKQQDHKDGRDLYLGSRTLKKLEAKRRPNPSTLCEVCMHAVWIATNQPTTLKSYCKELYQMSWTDQEAVPITHCDAMVPRFQNQDGA